MLATSAGIGLFLSHIGLQASEGIGVVTYNSATLVTLGGCPPAYRTNQYTIPSAAVDDGSICTVTDGVASATGALFTPSGERAPQAARPRSRARTACCRAAGAPSPPPR